MLALFGFESLQSYELVVHRASYKMPSFKSSLSTRLARKPTSLRISNIMDLSKFSTSPTTENSARSLRCLIELLKYNYGKVLLIIDIRGSSLTQEDFDRIGEKHLNAMARIKDIESYRFNL